MNPTIKSILDDLYAIDPAFRAHEAELTALVQNLISSRPNTQFDDAFAARLKAEVLEKARELAAKPAAEGFIFNFMQWNKLAYALSGVALTLIITIPLVSYYNRPGGDKRSDSIAARFGQPTITRLSGNAFGPFNAAGSGVQSDAAAGAPMAPLAFGRGGGGGGDANMGAGGESTKMIAPGIMPPIEYTIYEYEYTGDPLTVPGNDAAVYRRVVKKLQADTGTVNGAAGGFLDTGKFQTPYLQSFSVSEDREFGYTFSFNGDDGSVSIAANWQKWPQSGNDCRDEACWQALRLKPSDVLPDDQLIRMAGDFLNEYDIDASAYGQPFVRKEQQLIYTLARSAEGAPLTDDMWIPEVMSVVYPMSIEGKGVIDEAGNQQGLNVNINLRHKKVNDVYGLRALDFESSAYALEQDVKRIEKIAENGGSQWYYRDESAQAKRVTLKLGTPTVEFMSYWRFDQKTGRGDEMYVPALSFPIINLDEAKDFYRTRVLVPIVKELLDEREPQDGHNIPGPQPMPVEPDNGIGNTEPSPDQPVDNGGTTPADPVVTPGIPGIVEPAPLPEVPATDGGGSDPTPEPLIQQRAR